MNSILLLALVFPFGFFIESIIGFGGLLVSFTILGFFMDIKEIIILGLYIGIISSLVVLSSNIKAFSLKQFLHIFPISCIGLVVGVILLVNLKSVFLFKLFGAYLMVVVLLRIISLKKGKNKFRYWRKSLFFTPILLGGVVQGLYGIGGPFILVAMMHKFKDKYELRTTMAMYFLLSNILRLLQLYFVSKVDIYSALDMWWIAIPIPIVSYLGYFVHKRIAQNHFEKCLNLLILISAMVILLK